MSADTLTVSLFLASTAVSVAGVGVGAAGWRHRLLISALFVLAAILVIASAAWPFLAPRFPELATNVSTVAGNPISWFVAVMVLLVALLPRNRLNWRYKETSDTNNQKAFSGDGLYVGNVQANIASLATEFFIDLTIQAFNGTDTLVAIADLRGSIKVSSCPANGGSTSEIGMLPTPRIKEEVFSVKSIKRAAEFYIVLEQRVPRSSAEEMIKVIDRGDSIQLGMNELDIFVSPSDNTSRKVRLPLWNGVSISKRPSFIFSGRIIEVSTRETLRVRSDP